MIKSLEGKTSSEITSLVPVEHWVAYISFNKTQYAFGKNISEAMKKLRDKGYNGITTFLQHENPNKKHVFSVVA